ncbi:MAG TPA: peptidase M10 [Flavisolibacter sp.]|jgi:hypothetical protein|nr:peptidase M10 [Flavisolibacter sp.]
MGEVELMSQQLVISSNIITYGTAATDVLTEQIRDEIETMWNEARGTILINEERWEVVFRITAQCMPAITELEVLQNVVPRNNYFRIEEFVQGSISFVDGLGCNSGYFLLENLYKGSTTAAHEYGHTLGLDHPQNMDIRGQGAPGIMYPRGTLVDAQYQYDPSISAGLKGGTMHPMYRRVREEDIQGLKLQRLRFDGRKATLGEFTNIYHWNHAEGNAELLSFPPLLG